MEDQTDLTIRPFRDDDVNAISELVRQTWISEPDVMAGTLAARAILGHYLMDHEWGLVAERAGKVRGTILAGLRDTDQSERWRPFVREVLERARAIDPSLPDRVREAAHDEVVEARITRELKASGSPQSDATIQLLLLSPEARGHHVGGRLLDGARTWMRSQGARGYFLMTDDDCDVGFYDHKGLTRMDTVAIEHEGSPFNIYTYGELL